MKNLWIRWVRFAFRSVFLGILHSVMAQDFALNMQPDSLTLIPGQNSSFIVSLSPLDGFSTNVSLSVVALPAGVTARFSPQQLKPPGTSVLTLTAATNAALGSFSLDVMAVGGGITNTTTKSVTVNFGLLPTCTGALAGVVTDGETGLPIPGAVVTAAYEYSLFATTDTNGVFAFTNLPVGVNNAPAQYSVYAQSSDYWHSRTVGAYVVCDTTNSVNFELIRQQHGSISGNVSGEGGGPVTNILINISGAGSDHSVTTDSNGNFSQSGLPLEYTNGPAAYTISSSSDGFWSYSTNAVIHANSNTVVDIELFPVCYVSVVGKVFYSDTLLPATNVTVVTYSSLGQLYTNTDTAGNYAFTDVPLGFDNVSRAVEFTVTASGYVENRTNISIMKCGEMDVVPTIYLDPVPVVTRNYGAVSGHVYDIQTGLPLVGASVSATYGGSATTDKAGYYLVTNIFTGTGSATQGLEPFYVGKTGYFQSVSNVVVNAGQTNTQDFNLLQIGYGGIQGFVRDSVTTLPLTNALILVSTIGYIHTDTNGYYFIGPIALSSGNRPVNIEISTTDQGYYQSSLYTSVTNGVTNTVNLSLLKICTGATIVGNVVNALNQQPITNAIIRVSGVPAVTTDIHGNFILTNITVGNDNSPIQTTVNASAPGFNPQSHTVTIFCDATINTQFGAPQTAVAAIEGYVTNVVTGLPLAGVFIGSEFGQATMTDTNGFYTLADAPLGANNSSRTWTVTAIPSGFSAKTFSVTVSSNTVSTLDFGFGEPPTHLLLTDVSAPAPVTVGSNVVYTVTLTNDGADAADIQLTDTLSQNLRFVSASVTNLSNATFTAPVFTNGTVTTTATNLPAGGSAVLLVAAIPAITGPFNNQAIVKSSTPDTDPTGANRMAFATNTATAPVILNADLSITLTAAPDPVVLGQPLTYLFIVSNSGPADAPDVVVDDSLPSTATLVAASSGPGIFTQTGQALHWDLGALPSGAIVTNTFVVTPSVAGFLENGVTVSLGTQVLGVVDPNLDNNSASVVTTVKEPITYVDLGVDLTAAPNPASVDSQLTYTFVVSNSGPGDAPDVALDGLLPASTSFVSATSSQGVFTQSGSDMHWDLGALADKATATAILVVVPTASGLLTNTATVAFGPEVTGVIDSNPDNDTASVITLVNPTQIGTNVVIQMVGGIVFNPQTGLYEQTVQVQNLNDVSASAVRLSVLGLPSFVTLYNGSGITNGVPYVQYNQTVAAGAALSFALEYYNSSRQNFASTNFSAIATLPSTRTAPTGTLVQLDRPPTLHDGQLLIEFASTPGATYVVQYSADLTNWIDAVPAIVAPNSRVQWIDAGPPKTTSPPGAPGQRFYQVLQLSGRPGPPLPPQPPGLQPPPIP